MCWWFLQTKVVNSLFLFYYDIRRCSSISYLSILFLKDNHDNRIIVPFMSSTEENLNNMLVFYYKLHLSRQLTRIRAIQNALVEMGAIEKVLPLLARSNDDIAKETLAFLSTLLFNANKDVQA